jgi:uroporphyrinogen decarboxylase
MNKRELILSLLDESQPMDTVPAAFFLHFPPEFHAGQAAVDKHLEYFRYTGMDLVKIQYERTFPKIPAIQRPEDWVKMPKYDLDFFEGQLKAVEGLVKGMKDEAVVVVTLYSPFMCAEHTTSSDLLPQHLAENADQVIKGMEVITESMLGFVRECIRLGVDGFYMSTQGGEAGRPYDAGVFEKAIQPYDLAVMDEVVAGCDFNILHVCDYRLDYADFARFLDYPGDVVNCPLNLDDGQITMKEATRLFKRPVMGGLERKGVITTGTPEQVKQATESLLKDAPERFILGADCTVLADTPWENLKAAIDTAHSWGK